MRRGVSKTYIFSLQARRQYRKAAVHGSSEKIILCPRRAWSKGEAKSILRLKERIQLDNEIHNAWREADNLLLHPEQPCIRLTCRERDVESEVSLSFFDISCRPME